MTITELVAEITAHFLPNTLITPEAVVTRNVVRAIRKLNQSAPPIRYEQISVPTNRATLSANVLQVFKVYHNGTPPDQFPLTGIESTLLGYRVLPTDDVGILAGSTQYLKDLFALLGEVYHWRFLSPYLYVDDVPADASTLFVQEYRKIATSGSPEEDLDERSTDWVFEYGLALTKITEGRLLMTTRSAEVDFAGAPLKAEGTADVEKLERRLQNNMKVILWGGRST